MVKCKMLLFETSSVNNVHIVLTIKHNFSRNRESSMPVKLLRLATEQIRVTNNTNKMNEQLCILHDPN